jgi:hypothetical protein
LQALCQPRCNRVRRCRTKYWPAAYLCGWGRDRPQDRPTLWRRLEDFQTTSAVPLLHLCLCTRAIRVRGRRFDSDKHVPEFPHVFYAQARSSHPGLHRTERQTSLEAHLPSCLAEQFLNQAVKVSSQIWKSFFLRTDIQVDLFWEMSGGAWKRVVGSLLVGSVAALLIVVAFTPSDAEISAGEKVILVLHIPPFSCAEPTCPTVSSEAFGRRRRAAAVSFLLSG